MQTIRVYINLQIRSGKTITVTGEDFHYLKNVMRVSNGRIINIFNEKDGEFSSIVKSVTKKDIILDVMENIKTSETENITDTELIFTPIRHTRQDILIEKATELGVTTLSPIITENTSVKDINTERALSIAKQAAEQSRRLSIPKINELVTFNNKIKNFNFSERKLIYLDERQNLTNPTTAKILEKYQNTPTSFLIGPEGGFTIEEFQILENSNAIGISLGQRILRAETASIAVLAIYNLMK